MKNLLIKLGLWEEKKEEDHGSVTRSFLEASTGGNVLVDKGWYEIAMKHYCGTCKQWFKTASIATHNRFKHKDA